jgi:hypothetical protein
MNVVVGCSFTISKKLESLIEAGNPVYIQINSVNGNKGIGHMSLTAKRMPRPEEIGNTSIMLDVISVDESSPDFHDSPPVSNLFSGGFEVGIEATGSPITRFAKVNPEAEIKGYTNRHETPLKTPEKDDPRPVRQARQDITPPSQRTPEPVEEESPLPQDKQGSIMTYEELMEEIESLGNIDVEPIMAGNSNGRLSRTAALQIEKQGKLAPRIKRPAFVRNVRGGHIEIADMDEKIADKEIFDLGRVAAKKIKNSRDLKWCLDNGLLAFCNRDEYLYWLENRDSGVTKHDHGLRTGSVNEIESGMFNDFPDPMIGEYREGNTREAGRSRPSQTPRRPERQAVNRGGNTDIIDTDVEAGDDDFDDSQRRKLIDSMDPGGMPRDGGRTIPSSQGYPRATPPPLAGGGARVKSIRKV